MVLLAAVLSHDCITPRGCLVSMSDRSFAFLDVKGQRSVAVALLVLSYFICRQCSSLYSDPLIPLFSPCCALFLGSPEEQVAKKNVKT